MEKQHLAQLAELKANGDSYGLARHPMIHLEPRLAMELIGDSGKRWNILAQRPPLSPFLHGLEILEEDKKVAVRAALAANPAIANFPRRIVSFHKANDATIVKKLSKDLSFEVRLALAGNAVVIAKFPKVAKYLANDENPTVRTGLAHNSAIAKFPEVVEKLSTDEDPLTRSILASNPIIIDYPDLVNMFMNNCDIDSLEGLATNPAISKLVNVAEKLSKDPHFTVRQWLALNSAVAELPVVAENLANDNNSEIRQWLAGNPAIAQYPELVKKLANDGDPLVRLQLVENSAVGQSPYPHLDAD